MPLMRVDRCSATAARSGRWRWRIICARYGHKLNLTSGKSGLILDVVMETGNPADSERFLLMLDRHIYGKPPRQTAADFASR